jgi:hypothetical protein
MTDLAYAGRHEVTKAGSPASLVSLRRGGFVVAPQARAVLR